LAKGHQISYSYNHLGLAAHLTNARGQVTTYQYDSAGRLLSFTDPVGTVSYTYDPNGNVLTISGSVYGTITRTYDALNRVTSYTDSQGNTIQYVYDKAGNLATLTYPGGKQVQYGYDPANRLTTVTDWAGRSTTYQYDQDNRLVKTTRPDSTVLTQIYDAAGQLTEQKDADSKGNVIAQYDYTYDANGNPKTEQAVPDPQTFSLPNAVCTYAYDNQVATFNGQAVTYDADGNMTNGPLNGTMSNFAYDARNRLIQAGSTTYMYDAENNRIGVADSVYQTDDSYVINPQAALSQVLIKTDAEVNKTYYVYGLGLIGQYDSSGNYLTYHFDRRGSTIALTDSNGNITDTFQYGPYGELVNRTGTDSTPFLYNGQDGVMTDANCLYYMRARYYDTSIRRFINQDVKLGDINNDLSLNRYAYVDGQPVSNVDPFGLCSANSSGGSYQQAIQLADDEEDPEEEQEDLDQTLEAMGDIGMNIRLEIDADNADSVLYSSNPNTAPLQVTGQPQSVDQAVNGASSEPQVNSNDLTPIVNQNQQYLETGYEAGDTTPNGRALTAHGAESANNRDFDLQTIDNIVNNNKNNRVKEIDQDTGDVTWRYQDNRGNTVITDEWSNRIVTVYSYPITANGGVYIPKP
jgi:RHS repeat-associated protein